ncbi:MAG TPA: CehA/McbA family metallohydrolase [Verrucomicrobiota bacterium]|nr:CehA/McbA family metallohydrolase [Verrucomicrobiota bacterium]
MNVLRRLLARALFHGNLQLACLTIGALLTSAAIGAQITGTVVDEKSGDLLPARIYMQDADGNWHFVDPASPRGSAVRYAKTNWVNPKSVEVHTTISAHPFRAELAPGKYSFTIERGKEYRPLVRTIEVNAQDLQLRFPLSRWINMEALGWFSGDTHLHRTVEELNNVILAEDLNVAFPLTFWVTTAFTAPSRSGLNMPGENQAKLVLLDETHAIWPRNTEYEINSIDSKQHTLGALFLLNHRSVLANAVPPWEPVANKAKFEGALLDMDKLDWPFALMLPPVTGAQLYELANNHMWRTEYAFTNYVSFAPPYLHPPYGSRVGTERDWTLYTFGMYYTLLNAGFRCVPSAGTASGVHPVPAGFGRVYVHLPEGFSYEQWTKALAAGRSFVTTGPMLFATVNGRDPGETFRQTEPKAAYQIAGSVISEEPLAFIEVIRDGIPAITIMPKNELTPQGARRTEFTADITFDHSGWLAVRCWEERPGERFRWAHTAPWHIELPGKPLRPRKEEKDFLVSRMRFEIQRSSSLLPPQARAEYARALAFYEKLDVQDDSQQVSMQGRPPKNEMDLRYWLENMICDHGFTADEVRMATGLGLDAIEKAQKQYAIPNTRSASARLQNLRVLPYPGGRHPRSGFLDGALNPMRDTKFSVFLPWDERSYVVVDAPEAIWSNLGLTFLAHEHIETIWTKQGKTLQPLEWNRRPDGSLDFERVLPNGIAFGTKVVPGPDAVRMEAWVRNGTTETLRDLRWQVCMMLKAAAGFHEQTGQNKAMRSPYIACKSNDGRRWIITAWDPMGRLWQNPPVPCIHSDPKFPDCPPGQTVRARGWISFYEGSELDAELERIENTGWRRTASAP